MKHIYTFKQFIQKPLLVALALLAMSSNAWGYYKSNVNVYSSPLNGGYVYVGTSNSCNANSCGTNTSDNASKQGGRTLQTSGNNTFYLCNNPKSGYVFKGWATSETSNSGEGVNNNPYTKSVSGSASIGGGTTHNFYAIFARMAARSTATMAFGAKLIGTDWNAGTTKSVTIDYVHAGKITATITGTNKTDFSLSSSSSSQSATVVSNNTNSESNSTITIYFKPSATGNKTAKLTISSNNGLASIEINLTGTGQATVNPTFTNSIASAYYVDDAALNLASLWTSNNPNGTITYSKVSFTPAVANETGATAPSITNNSLSLGQAGTLVIQMHQAASTGYYEKTAQHTIQINKRQNTLKANNSTSYNPTLYMDGTSTITLTATNTDYTNCPISVEQTNGAAIANYAYNQGSHAGTVTANQQLGTATWSLSQPGNYKYLAATGTFSVTVQTQAETTCYVLNQTAEETSGKTFDLNGRGKQLSIEARRSWGDLSASIKVYGIDANGTQTQILAPSWDDSYQTFTADISSKVYTKIKVEFSGGVNTKYFKNLKVTRLTYLNPTPSSLSITTTAEGNPIYRNEVGVETLNIKWSIANGGDIKIVSTNPKFTLSQNKITNTDCANGNNDITVYYTSAVAGTDEGKIIVYNNVFRKEINVTGTTVKRNQTIVWNTDLTTIPVGFALSATTSQNLAVTYTSSNPDAIQVLDNGSLNVLAAGEATITVNGVGNDEYNAVSDSRTFTVTNDLIQYIVWEQNLMNLKLGASNVTMTATAATDEVGEFPVRPITYTSSDESKVKVVNGNQLQIIAVGTAYVTATQAGGEDGAGNVFAAASPVQKKVVVRDPDAACENFVFQQNSDEEFFQMNTNEITGTTYTLSGEPEFLSVDLKRKYYTVLGMHIGNLGKYTKGGLILQQYVNGTWSDVRTFTESDMPVTDEGTSYKSFTNIPLNRKATKIRFVRPEGGQGYHYVCNCEVTLARYIETNQTSINFGETAVGSLAPHNLQLSYNNIQDGLTLTTNHDAYTVSPSYIDGSCGDKGNQTITVTYNPQVASAADNATLTISDGKTSRVVSLTGSASKINRAIHWDDLPEYNTVNMYERIELNASVSLDYDASIQAGEVEYVYSTDSKSFVDGKVRFLSDGDFTITAQAPETNEYNAAPEVTKHFHVLYRNDFTFEGQDSKWESEDNWSTGAEPVPASDVTIDEDVVLQTTATINSLTINEGKTLTIADGGVLNVGNGNSLSQATYGNIIVEAGGQLILGNGAVNVNDFTLYSNFQNEQPKSGQVSNPLQLTTHGEAYFILDLDPSGSASYGWYSFTVPFPVDAMQGVYRLDNGNWVKAVNEVNYAIMDYHEDLRAQGKYGWKKYRSILQPGTGYLMTVENALNTYRFTKTQDGNFNTAMTQTLTVTDGDEKDKGWNSIGNGTTSYVTYASTPRYAQLYNHSTNAYDIELTTGNALVVGAAYFVQATTNNSTITMQDASDATTGLLRAPQRDTESDICFVNLSLSTNGKSSDKLFVTCDDNAAATYTIGKDVMKMGATTGISVARIWANAKGTTLGAADVAYNGNEAIIPLGIYAPKDGEYTLSLNSNPMEDVYLTRNGVIVWNLSMSDYTFELNAGSDDSYALQVVRRVQNVATGVDAVDADNHGTIFAEKMIVNGQLFILRDGILYDAQGKKVSTL